MRPLRRPLRVASGFAHPTAPQYASRSTPRPTPSLLAAPTCARQSGAAVYHALAPGRTRPPLDEVSIECTNGQVGVPPASCTEQPEGVLQKSEWCQKGLFL